MVCAGALVAFSGPGIASEAQPTVPASGDVCPALADDYSFCSDDPWSANCEGFVAAAERLAALYRSELEGHPGWEASLKATVWWGCGSAHLSDLAALLGRIDTPRARALLQSEPYEGVSRESAGGAPSSAPPTAATDCNAPETAAARWKCADHELAAANAAHERIFEECKERVAPGLRSQLLGAEASWKRNRQTECAVEVAAYRDTDEDARAFVRARCLARTTRRRTQALLNTHPECADPR